MSKHACQLVLNQIARLWRAGLSGFLLLNLALLHAAVTPVVAGIAGRIAYFLPEPRAAPQR